MSANVNMATFACLGLMALTASYRRTQSPLNSNIQNRTPLYFAPAPTQCMAGFVNPPMSVRDKLLAA
jgi:hypothetical protein